MYDPHRVLSGAESSWNGDLRRCLTTILFLNIIKHRFRTVDGRATADSNDEIAAMLLVQFDTITDPSDRCMLSDLEESSTVCIPLFQDRFDLPDNIRLSSG